MPSASQTLAPRDSSTPCSAWGPARAMSFRARIAVASAAAVALTVVLASALVYVVAQEQLRAPIDDALKRRAAGITRRPLGVFDDPSGCDRARSRQRTAPG